MPTAANPDNVPKPETRVDLVSAPCVEKQTLTEIKYKLSNALQSSLDLRDTLSSFFSMVEQVIPLSGMEYLYSGRRISITLGTKKQHNANYNLTACDMPLGRISFYPKKRFSETELQTIETMIGILVFPLRNALLYREALESSLRDGLTQVGNRSALEMSLNRELSVAQRYNQRCSCLMIDLDYFKKINDTEGHQAGDIALKHVAKALSSTLRQTDQIFRYGGEEFVIVLGNTSHDRALLIADRIRSLIETSPVEHDNGVLSLTASLGVATNKLNDTRDSLMKRLDAALYFAKESGRNCVVSERALAAPEKSWAGSSEETIRADEKTLQDSRRVVSQLQR